MDKNNTPQNKKVPFNNPEPAWNPSDAMIQASNIHGLMQDRQLDSYDDLYQWSITERSR